MKHLIIKPGYFREVSPNENKKIDVGLDLNLWLRHELQRIGVPVSDLCCNDLPVAPGASADTRLTNPHLSGNNLVFDLLNVTTSTTTPNAFSVGLPTDAVVSMAISGNTLSYTNKAGITATLALPVYTETQTTLDSVDLDAGNILTIKYTGENGTQQTVTADLSSLVIDINTSSLVYNPLNGEITLTETDGSTHTIDIGPFVETVTSITTFAITANTLSLGYTDETGTEVINTVDLSPYVNVAETALTAVDSATIDFTTSGTANHTITAVVKPSTTNGQVLTTVGGVAVWVTPSVTTETALTVVDTPTINLTASGTSNHTLQADIIASVVNGQVLTTVGGNVVWQTPTAFVETTLTANDSSTIDFTTSGTSNHTVTAAVKVSGTAGNDISVNADGLFLDVSTKETQTTLDSATLSVGNILAIKYTGENGVQQSVSVDLSTLAIDINVASLAYNPITGVITLTETDGATHTIDIGPFVETVTTLTNNANGSFTYVSEDNTSTTWSETPVTANDTTLIAFTVSGTSNHTIEATIKPGTTDGQVLTTVGTTTVWADTNDYWRDKITEARVPDGVNDYTEEIKHNSDIFVNQDLRIGNGPGNLNSNTVVGVNAASLNLGINTSFIGTSAGAHNTGNKVIAVGNNAGTDNVANDAVFLGCGAGNSNAGTTNAIGIGNDALAGNQGNTVIGIGLSAAAGNTGGDVTAIGQDACGANTGAAVYAIGNGAAINNSGNSVIAIGEAAAHDNYGATYIVAIGPYAAQLNAGENVIAIGNDSAVNNASNDVIGIGQGAANMNSGAGAIAVGKQAMDANTGVNTIGIGTTACQTNAGLEVIGIGTGTLANNTGDKVIGLGATAGNTNTQNNRFIVHNDYLPSFANRATAVAAITIGSGAVAGNTYMYYNATTFAIEGVRL